MCVALAALDAVVHLRSASGERTVALCDLRRLPEERPDIETVLEPGELITAVELPPSSLAAHSTYRKVRDRSSYAFALVSVAAALALDGDAIADVRLALGGVAPKPWRAWRAEEALRGRPATEELAVQHRIGAGIRVPALGGDRDRGLGSHHDARHDRRRGGGRRRARHDTSQRPADAAAAALSHRAQGGRGQ
jgi:hypothetical protein